MTIRLLAIGKTDDAHLDTLLRLYSARLSHYIKFEFEALPDLKNTKNLSVQEQKNKEGELLLSKIRTTDPFFLLDENGKEFTSISFADELQKRMNSGIKTVTYIIGGPYGFSEAVYKKAAGTVSLSQMTFSHQMVRLFFIEQLYRAFTILHNEPYHHQ
jgi:23S rRNA (pseudouridine1915-N3)-methyltransferase